MAALNEVITREEFSQALRRFDSAEEKPCIAVAVSGGGDSMALALLIHEWTQARGGKIVALTVDHGLRPDSTAEARRVHDLLSQRGIEHHILTWTGDKPATHIQEEARQARYALLLAACARQNITTLALAHNIEDQAETFWMRLAHGSGLDGLAGMAESQVSDGIRIIRPLLSFSRARLRETCRAYGLEWIEDPSNTNARFLRPRLRAFENVLAGEGLTPQRLFRTAQKLESARAALEEMAARAFALCVQEYEEGYARLDVAAWLAWPRDLRLRVLSSVLRRVYPQDYAAGYDALEALCTAMEGDHFSGRTLAGCEIFPQGEKNIFVCREATAMEPRKPTVSGAIWDRRFRVHVEEGGCRDKRGMTGLDSHDSFEIGALGEDGLRQMRENPAQSVVLKKIERLPFKVKKTLPTLWRGEVFVSLALDYAAFLPSMRSINHCAKPQP